MNRIVLILLLTLLTASACAPQPQPLPTASPLPSQTSLPSETIPPSPSPSPTPGIGSSQVSPQDGMTLLYVPAGEFTMGSADGYASEAPPHTVSLSAFWIDQTEMTNGRYAACVEAGICERPIRKTSNLIDYYFGFEDYLDYPVIYISWQNAANYCAWVGRRLPTEAEWEKAARGTDGRTYPWGSNPPQTSLLNYNYELKDVSRTGSYPAGASPFGALDMAGNVQEWTSDWYDEAYYSVSPAVDPGGPQSGSHRVTRGGAFTGNERAVRVTHRFLDLPDKPSFDIGFRCVMDALP